MLLLIGLALFLHPRCFWLGYVLLKTYSSYVHTVQLNLNLTTHACCNYTTRHVSENTRDIGCVCTKDRWHEHACQVHTCTHETLVFSRVIMICTNSSRASLLCTNCTRAFWFARTPLVYFRLHGHAFSTYVASYFECFIGDLACAVLAWNNIYMHTSV